MGRATRAAAVTCVLAAVITVGCGGDDGAGVATVQIKTFQFTPRRLTVSSGAIVTWSNHDATTHTVTAGTSPNPSGRFDLRLAGKGSTASMRLVASSAYFCNVHQGMRGEILVREVSNR